MIFLKLEYAGQNEIGGLNPKIFWVIFFQPLLLDSEHGAYVVANTIAYSVAYAVAYVIAHRIAYLVAYAVT